MYVLLALLCLSACSIKEEKQVAPVRVETERVSGDDSFHWGCYVGEVEPESSTAVSFPGSGTVHIVLQHFVGLEKEVLEIHQKGEKEEEGPLLRKNSDQSEQG